MPTSYIVIQTRRGKGDEVVEALSEVEGIVKAYSVTGPYDVIAEIEDTNVDVGRFAVRHIQSLEAVMSLLTCPAGETGQLSTTAGRLLPVPGINGTA